MRLTPTLLFTLLVCLLVSPAAWAAQTVDETRPANDSARIEIENLAGSIQVTGWNRNEVHVTGTLGDDVEGLDISGTAEHLSLEVKIPHGENRHRDVEAHLQIHVPAGCHLEVETVSSSIDAADLSGGAELTSVSGDVTLSGHPATAEVETVSGNVRITGAGTPVDVQSVSGDVTLTGVADEIEVSTVDGTIAVTADEIRRGKIQAVSGSIRVSGRLAAGARLDLQGHSSDVTLGVPAGTSASFDVTTFSGDIDNALGPEAQSTSRYTPGKKLEFSTGSGDARVSIETFSGDVTLKQM